MAKTIEKKKPVAGETTKVHFCGCDHPGQDAIYGQHKRLHNRGVKNASILWRCTVCAATK